MEEKNKNLIRETVEELFSKMGFDCEVEIEINSSDPDQESYLCNVKTSDDSNFLIGQYGTNLQALQHLARLLVRKKTEDKIKFIMDINSYRKQKDASVIKTAQLGAEQALREKRAVVMRPMSNYERRIVHLELSKNSKILTESIGEGEGRKVVIKPAETL